MDAAAAEDGAAMSDMRAAVTELVFKLEAANPTQAPAASPLLNGVWEVAYSGGAAPGPVGFSPTRPLALALYAGGYSPGAALLDLANLLPSGSLDAAGAPTVTISRSQPRVEASLSLKLGGGGGGAAIVRATLECESDARLRETYTSIEVAGRALDLPEALRYSRRLYVTYLDQELMVVRGESGAADVLVRASPPQQETVPSTADDDEAPGAG